MYFITKNKVKQNIQTSPEQAPAVTKIEQPKQEDETDAMLERQQTVASKVEQAVQKEESPTQDVVTEPVASDEPIVAEPANVSQET